MIPPRAPNFGQRGLGSAPLMHAPGGIIGAETIPPRRMRSRMVAVGCVSAIALGLAAASEYQPQSCTPQNPADPNSIPDNCQSSSSGGHSYAGHGYYGFSGSSGFGAWSSASHDSFGGFGGAGEGHGSAT
jgi:hypothetical protein